MEALSKAIEFLILITFDFYILILLLHLLLFWLGADSYNPFWKFIEKLTNPVLLPLRRFIRPVRHIDFAAVILVLILELIKLVATVWLKIKIFPNIFGLLVWGLAELLQQTVNIFFFAILIMTLISWVQPGGNSPVINLLRRLAEPLLKIARRYVPLVAGIDLSPLIVLVILQLINILISEPLIVLGMRISIGKF